MIDDDAVSAELDNWRQGDCFLSAIDLPYLDVENEVVVAGAIGATLITQSCDIVRKYSMRPFLHVAALILVTPDDIKRIEAGREVRYLFIPSLRDRLLVADLDFTATIDKRVIMGRERISGCSNDTERRKFAATIARHRQRYAFPDEFNNSLKPLRRLIERGSGADSERGRFIDAILEIRVASNSWDNPKELEFICVMQEGLDHAQRAKWAQEFLPQLENKAKNQWCDACSFRMSTHSEMSVSEYLETDRLDFDGLSDA